MNIDLVVRSARSSGSQALKAPARPSLAARSPATNRSRAERWRSRARTSRRATRAPRFRPAWPPIRGPRTRSAAHATVAARQRDPHPARVRPFARGPTAAPMTVDETDERLRRLDVRAANFEQEARPLSGGNQQKVIIVRGSRAIRGAGLLRADARHRRRRQGGHMQDHARFRRPGARNR